MSHQVKNSINELIPPYINSSILKSILNKLNLNKEIKTNNNILSLINRFLDEFLLLIINHQFSIEIKFDHEYIKLSLETIFKEDTLIDNAIEYAGYGINLNHYQDNLFSNHTNYFINLNNNVKKSIDERRVLIADKLNNHGLGLESTSNTNLFNKLFKGFNKSKLDGDVNSSNNDSTRNSSCSNNSNKVSTMSTMSTNNAGIYSPKTLYEGLRNMCLNHGALQRKSLDSKWKVTKLNQQLINISTAIYTSRILEHITHFIILNSIQQLNLMKQSHELMKIQFDLNKSLSYEINYELIIHTFYQEESLLKLFNKLNMKHKLQKQHNTTTATPTNNNSNTSNLNLKNKTIINKLNNFTTSSPLLNFNNSSSCNLSEYNTTKRASNPQTQDKERYSIEPITSDINLNFNSSNSTLKSIPFETELFDEILRSDETFKLSLTPSKLKFNSFS
ncbi:hypothetical protein K502DRAFT_322917 [Neoconidiobolus thromboides FSU 785]|nr:hypothetical protein K502DRAFT_322917 [Neoconidiobolus thromboides FSU 785]